MSRFFFPCQKIPNGWVSFFKAHKEVHENKTEVFIYEQHYIPAVISQTVFSTACYLHDDEKAFDTLNHMVSDITTTA